ncbi:hypothetical protein SAMN04515624_1643 [Eubacterium maltosivorans]|uniref:hypothetical protein n=1 Tax=Eubacterium maltosivorans TaxID=2041044 RepID=UPI00088ADA3E|nr:hypothetical protein [Eubacterium maltosivorans]SDP89732.1 hypothetical protein SAMN04515624_1643 [Eubacterium maltosivorans]
MAIGDTSIIKDANGVSITVKDIASDCLIEQTDGTYHRENYRTEASQVMNNCRSITFGISADYTASVGDLVLNKTFASGSPDYRDADTSLASLSSGNIAIKKTGRYLVIFNGELTVANITANPQFQIYCPKKNINLANGSFGLWADRYKGNVSGVAMLDAGDTLLLIVNFLSAGGASYGFKKGDTYCSLIYLGEK